MSDLILVQLATIKSMLTITVSDTDSDVLLTFLIKSVSADFQKYSGRNVDLIEYTEYFDSGENVKALFLKAYPYDVDAVDVFYDTARTFASTSELTANTDYVISESNAEAGIIDILSWTSSFPQAFKVVYTGGMAELTSPDSGEEFWTLYPDVSMAIAEQVLYEFENWNNLGKASVKLGDGNVSFHRPLKKLPRFLQKCKEYSRKI